MRPAIVALLGWFLLANLAGCGGTSIPEPPSDAKAAPPPGASAASEAWKKTAPKR
jgi:hypothetical protein